jgi:hypothetical protein
MLIPPFIGWAFPGLGKETAARMPILLTCKNSLLFITI